MLVFHSKSWCQPERKFERLKRMRWSGVSKRLFPDRGNLGLWIYKVVQSDEARQKKHFNKSKTPGQWDYLSLFVYKSTRLRRLNPSVGVYHDKVPCSKILNPYLHKNCIPLRLKVMDWGGLKALTFQRSPFCPAKREETERSNLDLLSLRRHCLFLLIYSSSGQCSSRYTVRNVDRWINCCCF